MKWSIVYAVNALTVCGAWLMLRELSLRPASVGVDELRLVVGEEEWGEFRSEPEGPGCATGCYTAGGHSFDCLDVEDDWVMTEDAFGGSYWNNPTTTPCNPLLRYTFDSPTLMCTGQGTDIGNCNSDTRKVLEDP